MLRGLKRISDMTLGLDAMQPVSAFIARMGLRGLGVNLSYKLEDSGEKRVLDLIGRKKPGFVCLDVGANSGRYAEAALAAGASKVVCFEPAPTTFEILQRNLGDVAAAELHQRAIGEAAGDVEIFVPKNLGLSSRDPEAAGFRREEAEAVTAPMTTIDDYCFGAEVFPDLVKIDVEGFEQEALTGAAQLVASDRRPDFVQFEFNLHHLQRGQALAAFRALLPGYHLFRLTMSGLSRIGAYRAVDTVDGYMNILASRAEKPF